MEREEGKGRKKREEGKGKRERKEEKKEGGREKEKRGKGRVTRAPKRFTHGEEKQKGGERSEPSPPQGNPPEAWSEAEAKSEFTETSPKRSDQGRGPKIPCPFFGDFRNPWKSKIR